MLGTIGRFPIAAVAILGGLLVALGFVTVDMFGGDGGHVFGGHGGQVGGGRSAGTVCLYTRGGIRGLEAAQKQLGVEANCTLAFDGGPDWTTWATPWFVDNPTSNYDWGKWVAGGSGRRLVVDADLIPKSAEADPNWRALGAAGAYAAYARQLALSLISRGLGLSYVRLGNEANDAATPDFIGPRPTDWANWRAFWRRTALTMSSVPGAKFSFIWCISPSIGHVPLSAYYPGNDVVNDIGVDVYDAGIAYTGDGRFSYLVNRAGGVAEVRQFAFAMRKPLVIPEWGLIPPDSGGGGDDPEFIRGIASLIQKGVAFQSYFDAGVSAEALANSPHSVEAYRSAFGNTRPVLSRLR